MDEIILRVLQIYRALSPGPPNSRLLFFNTTLLYYIIMIVTFFFFRYTLAKHALSMRHNNKTRLCVPASARE